MYTKLKSMKKFIYLFIYSIISFTCYPQVGIHTETPAGMLEVTSGNDKKLGLVLPIVAKLEDVEHVISGEIVKRGTIVFDEQRNTICHKTITGWSCFNGDTITDDGSPINPNEISHPTYVKASNTSTNARFGYFLSLSADGNTMAVGSFGEKSNATGINGNQSNASLTNAGAVYVFTRNGTTWTQQAYIKASNTASNAYFGSAISLSDDGNTMAVGAWGESSNAKGINGNQTNTSLDSAGAAYVFTRNGTTWTQQAYIKASNTATVYLRFAVTLSISDDGNTLVVGAFGEKSNATGINGNQSNASLTNAGAVYVFTRYGTTWTQQAYIKASNTAEGASFGVFVSLSADGNTMAVGANYEKSNATGINGNQSDTSLNGAGAAYVFTRNGTTWTQQAYIKASNTAGDALFGGYLFISADGNTLAVGAAGEKSNATGINGNQSNNSLANAGAVYVFTRNGTTWTQQAYIKASNTAANTNFGNVVSLSAKGNTLAVGSYYENSNATGIDGDQTNTSASRAGAAYLFTRNGTTWTQQAYIKASNTAANARFGAGIALSPDGSTLAVSANEEGSNATGINGNQNNTSTAGAGAVYVSKIR